MISSWIDWIKCYGDYHICLMKKYPGHIYLKLKCNLLNALNLFTVNSTWLKV